MSSRFGGIQSATSNRVILNVYDLNEMNEYLYAFGFGLYHSGIQIGGLEWSFAGGSGIYSDDPKSAPATFRESIELGEFRGTSSDIDNIIDDLRQKFKSNSYNLLSQNCNCFSEDFSQRLLGKPIPGFVNRMANMGSMFECLLPKSMTDAQQDGASNTSIQPSGSRYRNSQVNASSSFSGTSARLGGSVNTAAAAEMVPMTTASSTSMSLEQKERARKARLEAFSR